MGDHCRHALRLVVQGHSRRAAVRAAGVAPSTLWRWLESVRAAGVPVPDARRGAPPVIGRDDEQGLRARVEALPGASLAEHCARWEARGGRPVSRMTMQRALARIGVHLPGTGGGRRAARRPSVG